jgi:hypothetical protein
MLFTALIMVVATAWFYAAAAYQNHGYAWADQTCSTISNFCESPQKVGVIAIAVITIFLFARVMRT